MLFEQILSLIPCAVFWKDSNGIFRGCNQHFLAFAGIKNKNLLIGKTDKELSWADRHEEYYRDDQHVMSSGETIVRIEEVSLIDKKIMAHTTKTQWLKEGQPVGVLGVIYDITELVEAKEQAEIANYLKSKFVQNMQHDIRTPASGVWSVLCDMAQEELDPEKKKKLCLLRNSAKQLYDICNDVIDFDKAERGEIPVTSKKLSIKKLISEVVDLNRAIALKKKLDLSFTVDEKIPLVLKGDKHRISRILINLVGNAIKFTPHGRVVIAAKLLKIQNKEVIVQFEVHDTGIGIPEEKKNLIYEKFSRGTSSNYGAYKGSGLGLQIVKKYVADLNAEINVHSEMIKGTSFYVSIPLEKPLIDEIYDEYDDSFEQNKEEYIDDEVANIESGAVPSSSLIAGKGIKILLIEDDRLGQMAVMNAIKSTDCQVVLADNVEKALRVLDSQLFDLVVSDIGLPDGSGFDIISAVKSNPQNLNYNTPFIALTAHSDQNKKMEFQFHGFALVMSKPLMKDQVKSLFERFIYNKQPSIL